MECGVGEAVAEGVPWIVSGGRSEGREEEERGTYHGSAESSTYWWPNTRVPLGRIAPESPMERPEWR